MFKNTKALTNLREHSTSDFFIPALSMGVIFFALALPSNYVDFKDGYWPLVLPSELFLILLALALPYQYRALNHILALILCTSLTLKIADIGMWRVYSRPFNVVLDGPLLLKGVHLLGGILGNTIASIIIFIGLLALLCLLALLGFGFVAIQKKFSTNAYLWRRLAGLGISLWVVLACLGWPPARSPTLSYLWLRGNEFYTGWQDLTDFSAQLSQEPTTQEANPGLLEKLKGHDVIVVFVESYGRTLLANQTSADNFSNFLDAQYAKLYAQGYFARSHFLTSSTVGGISWLAHATTLSGLWVDNQARYDMLLKSQRKTLNQLFRQAGWRSVGIMPAITSDWPGGDYFGYDKFYGARDLSYRGSAFNWITMPDQYTLFAFEQLERSRKNRSNIFAEIVLISSHAPWTPIPEVLPWQSLNEPKAFDKMVVEGASPEWVWQDVNRIRSHYERSIEYVLASLTAYLEHYGDDNLVVLILGDHQPAPLITEGDGNKDVPIHIISKDHRIMEAIDNWHWSDGMLPKTEHAWRMDSLRDRWIQAFSTPP